MHNELDSFYQGFERSSIELLQSLEVVLAATENLSQHLPQASVWISPLKKLSRVIATYPKKIEFTQRFPEYKEQLHPAVIEVIIVGEAVAETLPTQARYPIYRFLESCQHMVNSLAS